MFGLNWLDVGGGGIPTEETGGFIAPAGTHQVSRRCNRNHFQLPVLKIYLSGEP